MKNKKFLMAMLLLTLFVWPAYGQSVKWGAVLKDDINFHHRQIVSPDPNHFIVLRNDNMADVRAFNAYGDFKLDSYDKTMKQVLSVALKPKLGNENLRPEFGLDLQGNIYIVSSNGDQKAKRADYYYQKLDPKTLSLQGAPVKFASGNHNQFTDPSFCVFSPSADSARVLVVTLNGGDEYANVFGIYVMDKAMKQEWGKSVTLPVPAKGCYLQSSLLDKQGNVFLIVQNSSGDAKSPTSRAKEVYCVKNKTGELVKLKIASAQGTLTHAALMESAEGLICMGLYATSDPEETNGYVYARINPQTLAVEAMASKPFSTEFVQLSMKENARDKNKSTGLESHYIHSMIPMPDGNTLLLTEHAFDRIGSQSSLYVNLEIAALLVDAKGELVWAHKIPKRQLCKNVNWYSSFAAYVKDNDVILFYNDAKENLDKSLDLAVTEFENAGDNGVVVQATIHPDGEITRKALFSNADLKTLTMPMMSQRVGANQAMFVAKEFARYFYGLVTF